jgi:hypothetical protein
LTSENKAIVAILAFETGTNMRNIIPKWVEPSINAASSSSSGIARKKFNIKTTLKTGSAPGKTRAHIVPVRRRLLIMIYHGIRPEFTIIVRKKNHAYTVLNPNLRLSFDKGYAVRMHSIVLIDTPNMQRIIVTPIDLQNALRLATYI